MGFKEEIQNFNSNHSIKKVKVKSTIFNYIISGSGEKKVVLLSAGSGLYEGYYKHIEMLEQKYTVLAFDYPLGMKNIDELIDYMAEFFKSVNFDNSYLIAESVGGFIGQLYLKKYPDMVKGLILTNTGTITEKIDRKMKKEVMDEIKSTIKTVQMTPIYILKPALIRRTVKKIKEDLSDTVNTIYTKEYVSYFIEKLTKEKVIYLCNIALGFMETTSFKNKDFNEFEGEVAIISTSDDDLFDVNMNSELKTIFNKAICKGIKCGGHASFLFKTKDYIKILEEIIG